ncbi:MAG: hypothetical protein K6G11_10155 [Lachnospiraceae bacterium]|nr:hypothetical protein [Lachnospiraceae bacterium]
MKTYLLFRDKDFYWDVVESEHDKTLAFDMQLEVILNKMSAGDKEVHDICRKVILNPLFDKEEIIFRQKVFKDCVRNKWIFDEIDKMKKSLEAKKQSSGRAGLLWDHPESKVSIGIEVLNTYMDELKALKKLAEKRAGEFKSDGFTSLFARINGELNDTFFKEVKVELDKCLFKDGIEIGMNLSEGLKSSEYKLVEPQPVVKGFFNKLFSREKTISFRMDAPDDKDSITEMREKGLNSIGNTLMQAADHIQNFFIMLDRELSFYKGAINLCEYLQNLGLGLVYPNIHEENVGVVEYQGIIDIALTIQKNQPVVGNSGIIAEKRAVVISGANQGGKTTFLRSIGQAILFAQSGLFVPGEMFSTGIYSGLYTHFRKEEDTSMKSGKLDEELSRINDILEVIKPGACIMFNESFASTNEREGSEIGWQVLSALERSGMRIFIVTHFYELASLFKDNDVNAIFFRAERLEDGRRTFKITEGYAMKTGFGMDLYQEIFGE